MASIQSLGVGSGLLTSELVDKIIASERDATDARINARKAQIDAKVSAFGAVKNTIDALRTRAKALGDASSLLINTATSSDPAAVTATASSKAKSGVHTVKVDTLARAHTIASLRFEDITSVVGSGTLNFRFGTTALTPDGDYQSFTENPQRANVSVAIGEGNATLNGVRDAINAAGIGVSANIVNDGSGYLLVLSSEELGAANSMEINVTEGATAGLSALNFNLAASVPGTNMTQTVAAEDALVSIDGIPVTRNDNSIADVIDGLTFDLQSINEGAAAVVTVARDTAGIATRVQGFVDAFNDVRALTEELTKYDSEEKRGSLLTGDSAVRGIRAQLRRLMLTSVSGIDGATVRSLVDIGLTSDQTSKYFLTLDKTKLTAALAKDPVGVQGLLASHTSASDSLIELAGFGSKTAAGSYAVTVTRIATHGLVAGNSRGAGAYVPVTIGDGNDDLTVAIDGVSSGAIKLTHATYASGAAMAQEMQTRINADSSLKSAGVTVSVTYDASDNHYAIASTRYGAASQAAVTAIDTSTTADLGLVVRDGQAGVDAAGSINGVAANGSGQYLAVPSGPQSAAAGFVQGAATTSFDTPPLALNATNNSFALRVDGIETGTITLAAGDYTTGAALAAEIEAKINADGALAADGASVLVTYDAAQKRLMLTSAKKGSTSSVAVISVAAGATAALGFGVSLGTPGRDAAAVADPAGGIAAMIHGGALGERGSVTLVRGIMNRIDQALNSAVSFGGLFANKQSSFDAGLQDLSDEKAKFDKRMTALETRLRTQFAAADALISRLNSTSSYLSQQLGALSGGKSK